jgi:hypothetical protein
MGPRGVLAAPPDGPRHVAGRLPREDADDWGAGILGRQGAAPRHRSRPQGPGGETTVLVRGARAADRPQMSPSRGVEHLAPGRGATHPMRLAVPRGMA